MRTSLRDVVCRRFRTIVHSGGPIIKNVPDTIKAIEIFLFCDFLRKENLYNNLLNNLQNDDDFDGFSRLEDYFLDKKFFYFNTERAVELMLVLLNFKDEIKQYIKACEQFQMSINKMSYLYFLKNE